MPYRASDHHRPIDADALRARIPGWGADLDPADRPAFPRERTDLVSGAHWDFPERQEERTRRERSIEHTELPPVFGTVAPLHGVSGAIRRYAYATFSEGRSVHWLLLMLGDRVDAAGAHLGSLVSGRPDDPLTETGILTEGRHHPVASRFGRGRADMKHMWMDPLIVGAWPIAAVALLFVVRRKRR
ncbi:hypothetical protein FGG90_14380 [Clavibacter tessellarius]|uniref:Uncharacterized protein n=1 Tax=Clavibacter tessellarius TaxID=31965 RepID=A0A225CHQ6_9MICO|nr:hypothetical protein [Clavibacter michiganensis]MBT1635350.1 hypothetical protein [Clavibacter michiganensis]OQJ61946.1 hypothetical protein B5P24_02335 [Clavibacter michiganensis subsp. tessellarius]UKF35057.1 hypothetical protein FGG90_14380 [Clavibacter michiganensis subsp. tessellarius]